ncbi:MAG: 23S rRNA (adenine(2503)-C(2))-methyltransferase RlmN [Firmicutes bacterium]|nr:23S rRNA (adenine(2503)-C(2))-methyltransferase RlmN [Bacillota bacterium]
MEGLDGFSLTLAQWQEQLKAMGEKAFRGRQIFEWLHREKAVSYDQMTNLPLKLRERLSREVPLHLVRQELVQRSAKDETQKFLMTLWDHEQIETVLMKYHYGYSLCISSQVGCRMGCKFCASTLSGKKRDLMSGEMLQQIYEVERVAGVKVSHVVIMGCGEPFDNYDALLQFLEIIHDPAGKNLSLRNITVSTCGLVERMRQFADLDTGVTLAVSLHAPNDVIRKTLMPVAYQVTMEELMEACRYYTDKTHRRITFEYALAQGVNDSVEHAVELAKNLRGMLCHVNLIPVNPVAERSLSASDNDRVKRFLAVLEREHIPATVRREMGRDIDAACGQLRRRYEKGAENNHEGSSEV